MKHIKRFQLLLMLAGGILLGYGISSRFAAPADTMSETAPAICPEHGVAEPDCVRCHPELAATYQAAGDWCGEHGLPESQCALCHPELLARGVRPPADDAAGHSHVPGEASNPAPHDEPVLAALPYPGLSVVYRTNSPSCPTDQAEIHLATRETAERAGLVVQPVLTSPEAAHFEAPAEVVFDQNATTLFTSSLPVSIVRWLVEPGDRVREGEALATAESPDMAMLQAEYLEAWSDWCVHEKERERAAGLVARGLVDSASYERTQGGAASARARWVQSESRLRLAGMAAGDLDSLRAGGRVGSRFTLRSTTAGTLLERTASLGRQLEPGAELARIGDPDAIWIEAHLRERDAARVRDGQRVEFTGDGSALSRVTGEVIWISNYLDPQSRTATVRVRPDRGSTRLRAHEFGRLHLPDGPAELSIWVPRDAVQWEGCCNVVFVAEADDCFRPHKVEIAAGDEGHYRVTKGLQSGDRVVVAGSFLLKTELKKGSIGAGCCGLEAS